MTLIEYVADDPEGISVLPQKQAELGSPQSPKRVR